MQVFHLYMYVLYSMGPDSWNDVDLQLQQRCCCARQEVVDNASLKRLFLVLDSVKIPVETEFKIMHEPAATIC